MHRLDQDREPRTGQAEHLLDQLIYQAAPASRRELKLLFERHFFKLLTLLNKSALFPRPLTGRWIKALKEISFNESRSAQYRLDKVYFEFTEACDYFLSIRKLLKFSSASDEALAAEKHSIRHEFSWLAYLLSSCAA